MKFIDLENLQLKTFTESDALDYCQLNNINPLNITELNLYKNKLTDISGIRIFKNLQYLYLFENKIKNISNLKYLKQLITLHLSDNQIEDISVLSNLNYLKNLKIINLKLESDQIEYIKSLNNLKELWCNKGFKNMTVLKQLNKDIKIII